jgi:nitroreductase
MAVQGNVSELLVARYGCARAPRGIPSSDAIELMLSHRSFRSYLTKPLPENALEAIVAAAQSAATSSNMQSWSVVAVEDQAKRDRLAAIAGGQKHVSQCPLFLVFVADLSRHDRIAAIHNKVLFSSYLDFLLVSAIDAALAAQNAVLAAESIGLATLYVGAIRNDPEAVASLLKLPPHTLAVFGVCVGHPDPQAKAAIKPRLPQQAILHRQEYGIEQEQQLLNEYDDTLREFTSHYEPVPYSWTERIWTRLADMNYLEGREHMKDILRRIGFPIL